jgi:hypothetical protein
VSLARTWAACAFACASGHVTAATDLVARKASDRRPRRTLGVAAQHLVRDLLGLRVEAEVTSPLSDSGCCGSQFRLLLHRLDEVLENEFDGNQSVPAIRAAEFLTQPVDRLKQKVLVSLKEVQLLGEVERFVACGCASRGSFALDFRRSRSTLFRLTTGRRARFGNSRSNYPCATLNLPGPGPRPWSLRPCPSSSLPPREGRASFRATFRVLCLVIVPAVANCARA